MAWARAYGLIPDPGSSPHSVPLIGPGPGFDPDYAMTTDLDDPVIIASITAAGDEPAGAAADRWLCATGHCSLIDALRLPSVTDQQWRAVLTRRGMPRLSELLPGEVDPGGLLDDLDAWLDEADVPDGAPFLVSPARTMTST